MKREPFPFSISLLRTLDCTERRHDPFSLHDKENPVRGTEIDIPPTHDLNFLLFLFFDRNIEQQSFSRTLARPDTVLRGKSSNNGVRSRAASKRVVTRFIHEVYTYRERALISTALHFHSLGLACTRPLTKNSTIITYPSFFVQLFSY